MSASVTVNQKFFGLVEPGVDGTVLYSRIERDGDCPVQVRVLPARVRERSEDDVTKSILVDIRRTQ
jgi:hypothetical protein